MFLLGFTEFQLVDGIPMESTTAGILVTDSPVKAAIAFSALCRFMRVAKRDPEYSMLAGTFKRLIDAYRAAACARHASHGDALNKVDMWDKAQRGFGWVAIERFLEDGGDAPDELAQWVVAELEKPWPGGLRSVA